jgi:hypothetical protein
MSFQSVPNGIEVVLNATENGVPIVNVFNVKDSATHDDALLEAYCDAFDSWWTGYQQALTTDQYILNSIVATSLILATGPQHIKSFSSGHQGAAGGGGEAANAAAVVSWRTASIGRSFRGRTYFGGLAVGALVNAQNLTTTYQSGLTASAGALSTIIAGVGGALCVLSRYADKVLRITGLLTEIVTIIVDSKVDSQRRRTAN